MSQQIERLHLNIKTKTDQIIKLNRQAQQYKRRLSDFGDANRKIIQLQQKVALLTQEYQRCQNQLKVKTQQLRSFQQKIRQSKQQNIGYQQILYQNKTQIQGLIKKRSQYELKISTLSQELQRYALNLRSKDEEIANLKRQIEDLHKISQQKVTYTQNNYNSLSIEYQSAKKHLAQYQLAIQRLSAEFDRLHGIIGQLKKQKESLVEKNHNLSQQIRRLDNLNNDFEQQTKQIRLRLTDQTALQNRMNQHLSLMVMLFAQIQTLRNRIKDKQKQVVEVRKSSLAPNII